MINHNIAAAARNLAHDMQNILNALLSLNAANEKNTSLHSSIHPPSHRMSQADRIRNAQRHERLRELMACKVEKLAKGPFTEAQREFIRQEVDLLIHNGDAREGSLQRIAASLKVFTASKTGGTKTPPSTAAVRQQDTSRANANGNATAHTNAPGASGTPLNSELTVSIQRRHEHLADDVWAQLTRKDAEAYNREVMEYKRSLKRKEGEQRQFLEAQVKHRDELRQRQTEADAQQALMEKEQVRQWQVEESKKKEEMKRRFAEDRRLRDEQLKEAHDKKVREESHRREEDRRQAELLKELIAKEEAANELKKQKAKEEITRFQAINKKYEDEKQRLREKEAEMDKEHQRLFLEKLTKQEREREEALARMYEKQKHQQHMATQMQASAAEKAAEDERKAKEYAAKKEAEREAEERRKAEKSAQEKSKIKQFLAMQMIEKEHERQEEQRRMQRLREQMKREMEAAECAEMERHMRLKQKQEAQRRMLEEQMDSKLHQKPQFISEEEKRINAKLIEKALSPSRL